MSDQKKKQTPIEGEIVTPQALAQILKDAKPPAVPQLDMLVVRFEGLLEEALKNFDLTVREGFIGELWGGVDYRIDMKSERIERLDRLVNGFLGILDKAEQAEQKIRAVNRECFEQYIDSVRAARTYLEEQQKLVAVAASGPLQRQLEEAKVQAEIREHGLRGRPLPPPPPPPNPVDEFELKRQAAQRERQFEYELKLDSLEAEEEYQDKQTSSVTARILKIFGDPACGQAQKRMRIRNLIDTYGIMEEFLPFGVVELMQEEG